MDRLRFAKAFISSLFILLVAGLVNLDLIHSAKYRRLSQRNSIRLIPQAGARGRILDRNGAIIADNKLSYDVLLMPQDISEQEKPLREIAGVLEKDPADLEVCFQANYVAASIPVLLAENIGPEKAVALGELRTIFPTVVVQSNPIRRYPYGRMAAHILGYLQEIDRWRLTKLEDYGYKTKDIVGFGGLEERFDYYLRQEAGGVSVEIDHRGRLVRLLGFRQPVNGKDLQLTLDLRLQKITEQKLSDKKGCVIIMQPFTGEVLALASSPGFNPATFVEKDKSSIREIFRHPDSPLFNRATSGSYPPGSIFKVIVATAALETKRLDLSKTFFCQGDIFIGKQKFHCWETHYSQNLIQAIAHSCNIFFYKAGILVGPQTICDYALKFGFAHLIPFELPYQESGFLPSPLWKRVNKFGKWFPGDTANLSIGQGEVLVTPLQVTRMMAVFANRGYLVNPYIVKSVAGTPTILYKTKALNLSLREGTLNYIRQGLRDAVLDLKGTANVLAGLLVAVAGKTGTAQTSGGPPHAWFAGFFPFRAPRYVICVFLEQGGAGYQAALVAKQIIEAMLAEGLT